VPIWDGARLNILFKREIDRENPILDNKTSLYYMGIAHNNIFYSLAGGGLAGSYRSRFLAGSTSSSHYYFLLAFFLAFLASMAASSFFYGLLSFAGLDFIYFIDSSDPEGLETVLRLFILFLSFRISMIMVFWNFII